VNFAHEAASYRRYTTRSPPAATLRMRSRYIAFSTALAPEPVAASPACYLVC